MAELAFVGQALVGSATLGWPSTVADPPDVVRANGGTWALVQDPAILQAIQDAAAAQDSADTAAAKADSAYTLAGTNTRVYNSTDGPSGVPSVPSALWRRRNASNEVIGEWRWDGTSWVSQTVSGSIVSNMDVGFLTAGAAQMSQALIDKLVANTAAFMRVDIKNLFVTTGVFDTAVIDKIFTDVVVAKTSVAEAFIGENAILTGAITAPKITASEEMWTKVLGAHKIKVGEIDSNSFTSDVGFVGDMRTGILTSNVVKTEQLDANAVTAKHKITSALYQTTATANRGIKIDANFFRAWNASGNETFRIDAASGDVTANGAVFTGSKFQTALVDTGNQWGDKRWMELNEKGLFFYTGQPGFSPAAKFYVNTETNTMEFIGGAFTAGTIYGADIRSELNGSGSGGVIMQPGGLYGYDSTGQRMFTMASANGFVFADKRFGVGTIGGERIIINSSNDGGRMGVWFSDTGDGSIGGSATGGVYIEPNQGELNLRGQDGLGVVAWQGLTVNSGLISNARFRALDTPSTSLAANAHISVGGSAPGTLYLSSSASRFKLDQQILDLPDELLDVPMKDWIDKAEYDDRERLLALGVRDKYQQTVIDTPLRRVPGMVAEDVETTPGGEAFVTRDAEGQTLGLSYERLANARTAVLKRQLDELALRVQALETAA